MFNHISMGLQAVERKGRAVVLKIKGLPPSSMPSVFSQPQNIL
jgi:hypothetical protein